MSRHRRSNSSPLLFDPTLKPTWRMRLRQRLPRWRIPRPRLRLTARQRRLLVAAVVLAPIAAATIAWLRIRAETSATLVPGEVLLGRNAPLGGIRLLPDDNPWNTPVDERPVDPASDTWLTVIGLNTPLHPDFGTNRLRTVVYGIPYVVVDGFEIGGETPVFQYQDESDDGLYPIPENPPVEVGGDRHVLILDRSDWRLYELYLFGGTPEHRHAGSGAIFDLGSNASRPRGWTSADAAGLPILPGLIRADEVYDLGEIRHALRFTLPRTRSSFVYPARHQASRVDDVGRPPMGARLRLKRDVDLSAMPPGARVIAEALKRYGMILADNGSTMFVTGTADRRWKRADIDALKRLRTGDFEFVVPPPPPASDTTVQREIAKGLPGFSGR